MENIKCDVDKIMTELKLISAKEEQRKAETNEERVSQFMASVSQNIEKYLYKFGVPKRYLKPKSNCNGLNTNGSYYFFGPVGTGKTDKAVSLLKNKILKTLPVEKYSMLIFPENFALFVSVPSMLLDIRSSFKNEMSNESELIKKYISPEILILDDLGAEKSTEWVLQTLYIVINSRYENESQTIITSNLNLDEIKETLSDKIASRIGAMSDVVEIQGKDRRISLVNKK